LPRRRIVPGDAAVIAGSFAGTVNPGLFIRFRLMLFYCMQMCFPGGAIAVMVTAAAADSKQKNHCDQHRRGFYVMPFQFDYFNRHQIFLP